MHDPYLYADFMAGEAAFLAIVTLAIELSRAKKANSRFDWYAHRALVAALAFSVTCPVVARLTQSSALGVLLLPPTALYCMWTYWRGEYVKYRRRIAAEVAAGRTPKEALVYNAWARPDPE